MLVASSGCTGSPRSACDDDGSVRTVCGFHNPEDLVVLDEGRTVVVSEMRRDGAGGALAVWREGAEPRRLWPTRHLPGIAAGPGAGDPSCPPPSPDAFAPHGVVAAPPGLYVVNHGGRESVEIFALEGDARSLEARWRGCVELPAAASANDVAVGPQGEIVVSNMGPPGSMVRTSLWAEVGFATGDVLLWRSGVGWSQVPGSRARMPNGVALSPDGAWVYWAESAAGRVVRARLDGTERTEVAVEGRPDNLTWDASGGVYVAAHRSLSGLAWCLQRRPCRSGWELFRIALGAAEAESLLRDDGARLGAVATAQPAGDRVFLSAVFDDRIGIWSPPPTR